MIRVKHFVSFAGSVALAASLAGCGSSTGGTSNPDLSGGGGNMPDLKAPADLTPAPVLAQTGDPCTKDADCAASLGGPNPKGKCIKSTTLNGKTIPWADGYCQSPCRPSKGDPSTGLNNTDCPSATAVCAPTSQTAGVCFTACQTIGDCRDAYVCGNTTGTQTAGCIPIGESTCDPSQDPRPQNIKCPMGQRCVSYSSDNSYGQCADVCDPVLQDCAPPQQGTNGCVLDLSGTDGRGAGTDGTGTCIGVQTGVEGASCFYLNECVAGLQCFGQKCRQYCRDDGAGNVTAPPGLTGCPQGETCKDLTISGFTFGFKKNKTGICAP